MRQILVVSRARVSGSPCACCSWRRQRSGVPSAHLYVPALVLVLVLVLTLVLVLVLVLMPRSVDLASIRAAIARRETVEMVSRSVVDIASSPSSPFSSMVGMDEGAAAAARATTTDKAARNKSS